jgi:protein ATS1
MYACGQGLSGELGLGEGHERSLQPKQIADFPPNGTSIIQINSCMAHTVVVLSNGEVWGWGKGRKGQLGEPYADVWSPRKIEGVPFAVRRAVCGKDFTGLFASPEDGRTYLIGIGKNDRFNLRASLPASMLGWADVVASWGSIYILKQNGELLGFGRNDHGQLPPPGISTIRAVAAGSEHCLASTDTGKVLAWGWGEHGNCGEPTDANGDVNRRWNEVPVDGEAKAIFAGCATSFVMTTSEGEHG